METPPPNDSLKASLSPPVGGRLRSFRRDWKTNKCSSNMLNIITNGYVLPFISKPNLVRFPLIHWRYPQFLGNLLPWTETISVHLEWWQNPRNVMKGSDLHPKDRSIQLFTDTSNEGWSAHLEQTSTKDLWSDRRERLHITVTQKS